MRYFTLASKMSSLISNIVNHIQQLRNKNPGDFSPFVPPKIALGDELPSIVRHVASLKSDATKNLIEQAFVGLKASILKFSIENALADGWEDHAIAKFITETFAFSFSEDEIDTAIQSPETIIKQKIDYQNADILEEYLAGIIRIYSQNDRNQPAFKINSRAYVLSLMLLDQTFKEIRNPVTSIANDYTHLLNFYSNLSFNITDQSQFTKYNLIQLNDGVVFGEPGPPRLFDKNNNVTIFLCGIEDKAFHYLRKLKASYQFVLSCKPSGMYLMTGKVTTMRVQDHLETGNYFNSVNLDHSTITKLYDAAYSTLWINVVGDNQKRQSPRSITFEELTTDMMKHNESIITQVIHCEYILVAGEYLISHLDHEFIFYTTDEYHKRQSNPLQKGNARKRIKTFKIDEARIPLVTTTVLFDILKIKFRSVDLVEEYFTELVSR